MHECIVPPPDVLESGYRAAGRPGSDFADDLAAAREEMSEASNQLADRGARIGTLVGQVQEIRDTLDECDAELDFLGDQLQDL